METNSIKNPFYRLILYINKYESNYQNNAGIKDFVQKAQDYYEGKKNNDEKLNLLYKNLHQHFNKLFKSIIFLHQIQQKKEYFNDKGILRTNLVEYCFYKISTIWDISYQIADILISFKDKPRNQNKYVHLEKKFSNYLEALPNLNIEWYKNINLIRNRIVHGGINIQVFDADKRLCFQCYDIEMDDIIEYNCVYSNSKNNDIIFADNYFVYHTHLLYSYLYYFSEFILLELKQNNDYDISDEFLLDDPYNQLLEMCCGKSVITDWTLTDFSIFAKITQNLIVLDHCQGNLDLFATLSPKVFQEIINKYDCSSFPFIMMKNIKS